MKQYNMTYNLKPPRKNPLEYEDILGRRGDNQVSRNLDFD